MKGTVTGFTLLFDNCYVFYEKSDGQTDVDQK